MNRASLHLVARRVDRIIQRAAAHRQLRAVTTLGARPRVTGAPWIDNRGYVSIGADFRFSSSPACSHLVVEPRAYLIIGDAVTIGSGACIACTLAITIGDGVQIGRNVMILDTDFHESGAMGSAGESAQIVIEDGARLEDDVVVLKGARIGREARIRAAGVVTGMIGAEAVASGVPARARPRTGTQNGDLKAVVREIVEREIGATIPDSLGMLRLLLAVEEALGRRLRDDTLVGATSTDAIVEAVIRA